MVLQFGNMYSAPTQNHAVPGLTLGNPGGSKPDFTYGAPVSTGFGGFTHTPVTRAKGTPESILPQYNDPYNYIGQGAAQAQQHLDQGALAAYQARSGGYLAGRAEEDRRIGNDAAMSGYSQDLLRRQSFARGAQDQNVLGMMRAEEVAKHEQDAAQLAQSVGVSYAALSQSDKAEFLNAYIQWKARATARDAGKNQLLGQAIGIGANIFAPGLGTYFSGLLNSGGGVRSGGDTAGTRALGGP